MNPVETSRAVEPLEWFVVFHLESSNRMLSFLAFGRHKHVSAFGYLPGVRLWLLYDVQWAGTRTMLLDTAGVMAWTEGCDILKIAPPRARMAAASRLGFTCVNAVKHLLGLRCVAVTPSQLYRHILHHGGVTIGERRLAAPADA